MTDRHSEQPGAGALLPELYPLADRLAFLDDAADMLKGAGGAFKQALMHIVAAAEELKQVSCSDGNVRQALATLAMSQQFGVRTVVSGNPIADRAIRGQDSTVRCDTAAAEREARAALAGAAQALAMLQSALGRLADAGGHIATATGRVEAAAGGAVDLGETAQLAGVAPQEHPFFRQQPNTIGPDTAQV